MMSMYSAGLAEAAAAAAAAAGAAAAPSLGPGASETPDPVSSTHPQYGEYDDYRRSRRQHSWAGGGEGAPGWERGENGGGAQEEGEWEWPPQHGGCDADRGGADDGDGLLVKWSEELDFDR